MSRGTMIEPLFSSPLAAALIQAGLIDRETLGRAMAATRPGGAGLLTALLDGELVDETALARFLAARYRVGSVRLAELAPNPHLLDIIGERLARRHDVVPVAREGRVLTVATADPTNVVALDEVAFVTGLDVRAVVAPRRDIREAIERRHPSEPEQAWTRDGQWLLDDPDLARLQVLDGTDPRTPDAFELRDSAGEAPIVLLVNRVLLDAIRRGASDVHWEPGESALQLRFRIDGMLYEQGSLPKRVEPAIVSRLKIMANLDISERRLPQDGRIRLRYQDRDVDVRVSLVPMIFGEKINLRVLDKTAATHDLGALGLEGHALERVRSAIHQPSGMVLITGPTGSGKTTTLYSAIHAINSPDIHIVSVEDPVEYRMRGVNQAQVNDRIGCGFVQTLRSFLRQDPDVILVGETRDAETAQISVRAALTGHLLLSTMHTNDCVSAVSRLVDMGVAPFLIGASLHLVVAQRLVRKVCLDCREPHEADEAALARYGHEPSERGRYTAYRGKRCGSCNLTGFRGRVAIFEVMPVTEDMRDLIVRQAPAAELKALALRHGMRTLRQAGLARVLDGTTTLDEVLRVTP